MSDASDVSRTSKKPFNRAASPVGDRVFISWIEVLMNTSSPSRSQVEVLEAITAVLNQFPSQFPTSPSDLSTPFRVVPGP